jgi:TPP-dependent pyruvate/acetoin dehydrogenase alpha subunit
MIDARVCRWSAPSESHPVEERDPDAVAMWQERDPIGRFIGYLVSHRVAAEPELARIAREVDAELTEAVEFARSGAPPAIEESPADVPGGMEARLRGEV